MTATTEAQILSVAPFFDEEIAGGLLSQFLPVSDQTADPISLGTNAIRSLSFFGIISRGDGWCKINEGIRRRLVSDFKQEDSPRYSAAFSYYVNRVSDGKASVISSAVGNRAVDMYVAILRMSSSADQELPAFDALVGALSESAQSGRNGDALAASRLLEDIPLTEDRTRQRTFLRGWSLWNDERRAEAAPHLKYVWDAPVRDVAFGIAAHLLAAHYQIEGNARDALLYATESVNTLKTLGDTRGKAMAMTTLGRVERDLIERDPNLMDLGMDPIQTLQDAAEVAFAVSPRQAGVALTFLAGALQHQEQYEEALAAAKEAYDLLSERDPSRLRTISLVGGLHRTLGNLEEAQEILVEGVELARVTGQTLQEAILLNVLASNERVLKRFTDAIEHAAASVSLGRRLGHDKHLSRALHTQARILLDRADSMKDLEAAEAAAREAKAILELREDSRGLRFVETTIGLIQNRRDQFLADSS